MSAIDAIRDARLVAILRHADDVDRRVESLAAAGIRVIEITLDSDGALDAIARARSRGNLTVLAGTVREATQVDAAVAAGAEAIVSPAVSLPVLERAAALGTPAIPGALTPTEIETAWRAGAALVKLFPAGLGGPGYVRAVLAPLGDVPLLATGGVDAANARAFLDAGAVAVGVGSGLGDAADVRRLVASVRPQGV
jgi:2-dehydro-3-deoxyphosphogluconate aldolase/(4S)-4-hydroxy-2-oxoglutarate aldolase